MTCASSLSKLQRELASWYEASARVLPWRETSDPYHILLSEVILQQTRVDQGMAYYLRFVETWPSVQSLAEASEDEVLRLWQGLGYYSRGRNLLRAARMIVEEFDGQVPSDPKQLKRLPGVGAYTQAAVLSFAYDLPHAAVDGNVYRVLSRLYGLDAPIDRPEGVRAFRLLADQLLDRQHPGRHNQAMIELGALVCLPRSPRCSECPLEPYCVARRQGNAASLPVKVGKLRISERHLNYLLVLVGQGEQRQILLRRRGRGDIWQGLYELPLIETEQAVEPSELVGLEAWQALIAQLRSPRFVPSPRASLKHRLTHRLLHARLYLIEADAYEGSDYLSIDQQRREDYAMPILLDKMLQQLGL
ncbi:A/G-specific adenine glycosylase [Porphyromonas sp. COT-239 OH1446]|uniref:A/G-specific adenine glycosylase n=1 Tax=Porphyromonas sp. COT-239 OH1446 TaxID=1515613 RepID=UPI00052B569F|nr:A/G-specific adenine glycosylase [Porphyromonas sp. COT-239 OH1446]KGN68058.1 hypothetical protein HQ37_06750 [Porphyromonas sp. COT-239 OH1446]